MVGAEPLCKVPLFADIPNADVQSLSRALQERQFKKNQVIFFQGDEGSSLFIVGSGTVKIAVTSADGKEKTLALLSKGDFFGELSLLDGAPRSANAVATEVSQLYVLGRHQFLAFLKSHPNASLTILAALCCRLRRTDDLLQDVSFLDIPTRLLKTILDLARSQGTPGNGGTIIAPCLNQTELAALVGATRESVNKWLRFYQREGLLRLEHAQLTVFDLNKLQQHVSQRIC